MDSESLEPGISVRDSEPGISEPAAHPKILRSPPTKLKSPSGNAPNLAAGPGFETNNLGFRVSALTLGQGLGFRGLGFRGFRMFQVYRCGVHACAAPVTR